VTAWTQQSAAHMRLDTVATYRDGNTQMFVGAYHEGSDGYSLWALNWSDFVSRFSTSLADGLRLRSVATYLANGTRMYVGAYRTGTGGQVLYRAATWEAFDQVWKTQADGGMRLASLGV
jgi:hypothetical protein